MPNTTNRDSDFQAFVGEVSTLLGVSTNRAAEMVQDWDAQFERPTVAVDESVDGPQDREIVFTDSTNRSRPPQQSRSVQSATRRLGSNGGYSINADSVARSRPSTSRNDFPAYTLPTWGVNERDEVSDNYFHQLEYRLRWIFNRDEREGFSRNGRYGVRPFTPGDFERRLKLVGKEHPLSTETNKFYDWNIGGTDFILRLESFEINSNPCLRCHIIHKASDKEVCYQDRVWDGDRYYEVNMKWADTN